MASRTTIELTELNSSTYAEINAAISALESSAGDSPNQLLMKLNSTKGSVPLAILLVEQVHSTKKVDLLIEASGQLTSAGTILASAGKPKHRMASVSTVFNLSDNGGRIGKKEPSLTEKNVLELTGRFCNGKGRRILNSMRNCGALTASEAVKNLLIDGTGSFTDKYSLEKKAIKEANRRGGKPKKSDVAEVQAVSPLSEEEHAEVMEKVKNIKTPEEEAGK